jgi:hypothetical protein
MSDKAKYGYIAGIMDGEGTITICRSEYIAHKKRIAKNGDVKFYDSPTVGFHVKVSVKNTDVRLMKWLVSRFGGEFYPDKSPKPSNHKDAYVWHHKAESKQEFLLAILPYLIMKREQALVALEFLRLGCQVRCPEERQRLYEKIVALNQRGKPVETNMQEISQEIKIESELISDSESASAVTQMA